MLLSLKPTASQASENSVKAEKPVYGWERQRGGFISVGFIKYS